MAQHQYQPRFYQYQTLQFTVIATKFKTQKWFIAHLMIVVPVPKHFCVQTRLKKWTQNVVQSYKGSCILCKVLSKQFLYCSRFQPLRKNQFTHKAWSQQPHCTDRHGGSSTETPYRTKPNSVWTKVYNDVELLQTKEKQHKIQGELSEQVCIASVFTATSVLIVLQLLFLYSMFPM